MASFFKKVSATMGGLKKVYTLAGVLIDTYGFFEERMKEAFPEDTKPTKSR